MRQAFTWLGQIEPDKPSTWPSILALHINYYYLLSPSTLVFFFSFSFFAHLLFCTSHCFAHFILISLFLPYICSCVVLLLYHFLLFCTVHWADLIWCTFHFCIIYYVTNKETLNLIKMSLDVLKWIDCDLWLITYKLYLLHGCWTTITLTSI